MLVVYPLTHVEY